MRLYLSSFRLGSRPDALLALLRGRTRVAVIANADDHKTGADRVASFERERVDLETLGFAVSELDLRSFFAAPSGLRERLAECNLLWVRGGNPFVLRRAFRQSGADHLVHALLAADELVYAGYSAGGCILAPSLHGVELVDDPNVAPPGYDETIIWDGLGILPHGFLPHYRSDHPESAAISASADYMIARHLPFVALRRPRSTTNSRRRRSIRRRT